MEGREEDATAVIDVGCGGLGSDGEQGEAWLERLFGNGNAHCHLPVRQQVVTVGRYKRWQDEKEVEEGTFDHVHKGLTTQTISTKTVGGGQ